MKLYLLILLLISCFYLSCTKNRDGEPAQAYTIDSVVGTYYGQSQYHYIKDTIINDTAYNDTLTISKYSANSVWYTYAANGIWKSGAIVLNTLQGDTNWYTMHYWQTLKMNFDSTQKKVNTEQNSAHGIGRYTVLIKFLGVKN